MDYITRGKEKTYGFQGGIGSTGLDELRKCQEAFKKLLLPEYDSGGFPAFKSLRQAYTALTGDSEINGMFYPNRVSSGLRACMDFNSSSFSVLLQNAMNTYLSKVYRDIPFHEDVLISEKKEAKDLRTIHSVQIGYFKDIPDIDPETGDYQSPDNYEDTSASYELSQKGAIVWVTRMVIVNDGVDHVRAMTKRMALSARRAHARYVWNFYINNMTAPDGTAWFTEGHGNLGVDALDISPLVAAIKALANMTEPGSGEKIGMDLPSFNWHLVLPIDIWDLGVRTNQNQSYYASNDLTAKVANPCRRLFGEKNNRIITCPFFADNNDWGVIRNKEDVPIVEMSYLFGKEDPDFIIESGPTDEHVFLAEKIGYKIRHEYGGALADFRGGYKSIVP